MDSFRKWFYKPRRDDKSLLAQFFYADESLNLVAGELDSFDGRKDPERCTSLVNHLRHCQDKVLNICNRIMDELIPNERADRDFRVKFPDDVMQDNLGGQLWFGAECLAAGSSIMNRERESGAMRPLAKALTKSLETVRGLLREASLRVNPPSELAHDRLIESLKVFDRLLANFELCYVSAMVPVKTVAEYHLQQDVVVLFSETLQRALALDFLTQDMVDQYDPALMFTIPRLAIVTGLMIHPEGPLCLDSSPHNMSEMFRPFRTLLIKIRELLWTLSDGELLTLEKMLCSTNDPVTLNPNPTSTSEADVSEEESSGWGAEGETSECETVMERLPTLQSDRNVPNSLSFQVDDSGVVTLQSGSDSPGSPQVTEEPVTSGDGDEVMTPEEADQILDLEEDAASEGASSSTVQSGDFSLNGQWTLPIIPCACSTDMPEDVTMTKQGLMNRSLQQGSEFEFVLDSACEECLRQSETVTAVPSETETSVVAETEKSDDVRWPKGEDVRIDDTPGTSVSEQTNIGLTGDTVNSESDIISSDSGNANYKQNVSLRTIDGKQAGEEWKQKVQNGEASEDLHVRYTENWEALCASGQLPAICDKRGSGELATGSLSSSCPSCHSSFSVTSDSSVTSETSSFNSECQDSEEVALALLAVQTATRHEARAKFRSSGDLLHRLFVCISGVADQLQTNFAGDLRHVLKSVFLINSSDSQPEDEQEEETLTTQDIPPELCENGEEALVWGASRQGLTEGEGDPEDWRGVESVMGGEGVEAPPLWLPDEDAPFCMSCDAVFTVIRRRHHCRSCGKVFCARCSSNSIPLPRYGHMKPVRVCDLCFVIRVTPFSGRLESIATN